MEIPGLFELNRQSHTRRRGCHCWEVQEQLFAFCGLIGTACTDLLNRVFSTHLIDFLLRASKQERTSALKRLRYLRQPYAMIQVTTAKNCSCQFRPRQFRSVSAEPLAVTHGTPVEKHWSMQYIYTLRNLESYKCARMRFHCANGLVVLRSSAPRRERCLS